MMKKIIALALALSMALSMVAFAGYTDAELVNTDLSADVELVGALGLMTGNPDGSFNPTGTLTRGEAAVIVYRLSSGKKDIDKSWGDASLNGFTDMAGHWSAPYVNYCAALGLILGDPAGTFRPNDAVTAVEMAKMLLNAAGYDTEKQGYGKNWPAAVLADATNSGLFADFEAAYTAPASREWVAKLLTNLLSIKTVSYNIYTDKLVPNTTTFGAENYAVESFTGVVNATNTEYLGSSDIHTDKTHSLVGSTEIKFVIADELIGRKVKVYYENSKTATGATAPAYDEDEKVYAVVPCDKKVIETTLDQIILTKAATTNYPTLTIAGQTIVSNYDKDLYIVQYENLVQVASDSDIEFGKDAIKDVRPVTVTVNSTTTSTTVTLFYNDVKFGTVEKNSTTDGFKGAGVTVAKADYADNVVLNDTVAKDDYVMVEVLGNMEKVYAVSKLSPVTGKISAATPADDTFVMGGATYNVAANSSFDMNGFVDTLNATALKDNTYNVYALGNLVVFAELESGTVETGINTNIAYVIDSIAATGATNFATGTPAKVQVLLADGTIAIYEYDAPTTGALALESDHAFQNGVYEYKLTADGGIYFVQTAVNGTPADSDDGVVSSTISGSIGKMTAKSTLTVAGNTVYFDADTFLFVTLDNAKSGDTIKKDATYAVVKASELIGKDLTNYTFKTVAAYEKKSATGLNTLVYAVLDVNAGNENNMPGSASVAGEYFITTSDVTTVITADGSISTVNGINANGEVETLTLASTTGVVKNKIYKIATVDGKATLSAFSSGAANNLAEGWNKTLVTGILDGSVVLTDTTMPSDVAPDEKIEATSTLYNLADDVTVTYVYKTSEGDVVVKAVSGIKFTSLKDSYYTTVTDNEVEYVVYKHENGNKIYQDNGNTWKFVETKVATEAQDFVKASGTPSGKNVVPVTSDANAYSYVCIEGTGSDAVVTDIIIAVTSATSNTLKSASTALTFAVAE